MRSARPLKLVVDTNVLIRWLIGRRLAALDPALKSQRYILVISARYLKEVAEVVARPHLRRYFTLELAEQNIRRLQRTAWVLDEEPRVVAVCRDSKDDYLLAVAKASGADLLITGDEDLLVLKRYAKAEIVTPAAFVRDYL